MAEVSSFLSVVNLNVNGLKFQSKGRDQQKWIKKKT